jgi:ribonuclease VapC
LIVVDTSALMAIALNEPERDRCIRLLSREPELIMSTGTLLEVHIVAAGRDMTAEVAAVLESFRIQIVEVTEVSARRAGAAYRRSGKGFHPAKLNFGDCFAYELARSRDCPLLYVGEDFARTDVRGAITAAP